jgi:cell volume regulation protein A
MTGINALFLLTGLLLFISVLASTISARLGLPLLLLFLGVGMLAGEDGPGGIVFEDFFIASLIAQAALSVILLDGGLRTRVSSFRVALKPAAVLATWGVIGTAGLLGRVRHLAPRCRLAAGHAARGDRRLDRCGGGVRAPAQQRRAAQRARPGHAGDRVRCQRPDGDPARHRLVGMLLQPETASVGGFVWMLTSQLGLGAILGLAGGWVLSRLMARLTLPDGLYALLILSGGTLIFAATNLHERQRLPRGVPRRRGGRQPPQPRHRARVAGHGRPGLARPGGHVRGAGAAGDAIEDARLRHRGLRDGGVPHAGGASGRGGDRAGCLSAIRATSCST